MPALSAKTEHLYLLPNHDGWHAIPCGPVDDWPKHWNTTALPRLRELTGSPFIGNPPLCHDPEGRAAILRVYFGILGPEPTDPFHRAYPRARIDFSNHGPTILQMDFDPTVHPGILHCLQAFLGSPYWLFNRDSALACDRFSKKVMGALTGLGFLSSWPTHDNHEPGEPRESRQQIF